MSFQVIHISHRILINLNRHALVALLRFCNLHSKSIMLGSHKLGAIFEVQRIAIKLHDGCACVHVELA